MEEESAAATKLKIVATVILQDRYQRGSTAGTSGEEDALKDVGIQFVAGGEELDEDKKTAEREGH